MSSTCGSASGEAPGLPTKSRLLRPAARREQQLADALATRWHGVAEAMRGGRVGPDQAHAIVRALDRLPDEVPRGIVEEAERRLVVEAASDRRPYEMRLGSAFAAFLEHVDPQRLPLHGGDATTVMVTIDHATLAEQVGQSGVATIDDQPLSAAAVSPARLHGQDHPRRPRRRERGARPRSLPAAVQPSPAQGPRAAAQAVPGSRLPGQGRLDRGPPPPTTLVRGRRHRPRRRHPAVLLAPPQGTRPSLRDTVHADGDVTFHRRT